MGIATATATALALACCLGSAAGFAPAALSPSRRLGRLHAALSTSEPISVGEDGKFELEVALDNESKMKVKLRQTFEASTVYQVTYSLPFGLACEPKGGRGIVTKDGEVEVRPASHGACVGVTSGHVPRARGPPSQPGAAPVPPRA